MSNWWSDDTFPMTASRQEIAVLRQIGSPELGGEDWQPQATMEIALPITERQTHRHPGCGHPCGDSHCIVSDYMIDRLCTPCVRKWALGRV